MVFLNDVNELTDCININDFLSYIPNSHINLICFHINIRSIIKNFYALEQCIMTAKKCIDVIILTEANISNNISCLYNLDGYQMFTALRKSRKGGGIVVYVHNKHKCHSKIISTVHFENITLNLTTQSNYSAILCAIYRPPNYSKRLFVEEVKRVTKQMNTSNDLYLLGDINIDLKSDNPIKHTYSNTLHNLGLVCGITEYTRIEQYKGSISKTCIDHIFVRSRTQDLFTAVVGTKLADHCGVMFACVGPSIQAVPNYKTFIQNDKLEKLLNEVEWNTACNMSCPIMINKFIYDNFEECYAKASVKVKVKNNCSRSHNHWINNKVTQACRHRDQLFLKWIKDPNNNKLKKDYNKSRNYANKVIQNSKNIFIKKELTLNKQDPRRLWQLLNRITGRIRQSVDDMLRSAFGKDGATDKIIANSFAQSFVNSVKSITPNCSIPLLNKSLFNKPANISMRFKPADLESIAKITNSLKNNKTPGIDRIRVLDIKKLGDKINNVIVTLINQSVVTQKYPYILKSGIVRPIYKKGNRNEYINYRPITILPVIDKIVEKFISKQIYDFYSRHNIITDTQFGFQPHKSTTQLLTRFTDCIYKHLDNKKHIMVVFIDYTRAFDTLKHNILLEKLHDNGIRGNVKNWCKNFIEDRTFMVRVGKSDSDRINITEGTAQGSVLGPLHYISYVNDLPRLITKCELYQYADDTCLVSAGRTPEEALDTLQEEFNILAKWSHDAGLVLNSSKTKLMYISTSQNRSRFNRTLTAHDHECLHKHNNEFRDVICTCKPINMVDKQMYLGLVIDNRLNWKEHINHVCNNLRSILAKFTLIKRKIPFSIRLQMYKSLAESIINYGLSSYGRTFKSHLDKIYILQLRLLKEVVPLKIKIKFKNDYYELFKFCEILPIHLKIKKGLLCEEFFNDNLKPKPIKDDNNIITRRIMNMNHALPRFSNLYGKRKLNYIIPYLINELPTDLRDELTPNNIKHKLKSYFIQQLKKENN